MCYRLHLLHKLPKIGHPNIFDAKIPPILINTPSISKRPDNKEVFFSEKSCKICTQFLKLPNFSKQFLFPLECQEIKISLNTISNYSKNKINFYSIHYSKNENMQAQCNDEFC